MKSRVLTKLSFKVPAAMLALGFLIAAGVGIAGYEIAARTASDLTYERLGSIVDARDSEIQLYLDSLRLDIVSTTSSESVQNAVRDLRFGWIKAGDGASDVLRTAFAADKPAAPATVDPTAPDPAANYSSAHDRVNTPMLAWQKSRGYGDVLLIDLDGNVIYSTDKGKDFATNLLKDDAVANSPLGQLFKSATKGKLGDVFFSDIAPYAALGGKPVSFMLTPVFDKRAALIGVAAIEVPLARIQGILDNKTGLGTTGEVILTGADGLMRLDSKFTEGDDTLKTKVGGAMFDDAAKTGVGSGRLSSYRGQDLEVEVRSFAFAGVTWLIAAAQSSAEVFAPVAAMRDLMLVVGLMLLCLAAPLAFLMSRTITRPISRITSTMGKMAAGDLTLDVAGAQRTDELGEMARAVEVFRANGLKVAELTEADRMGQVSRTADRVAMMRSLQQGLGAVLDAAIAGDFTQRVTAGFADPELDALAGAINKLVAVVDRGLAETGTVLGAVAEMNLTGRVEGEYQGAFAKLKTDTNAVADKLSNVVRTLRRTSVSLKDATTEIMEGATDLAQRTAAQAAAVDETGNVLSQLAETVSQNAARAHDASANAASVCVIAEEGATAMKSATAAMERITSSSSRISTVIGLMDDIAFQTNLLALNASVEAARAGDAGKGFAVVAVEVRRLARSAADASSDVKQLIEESSKNVREGSDLVSVSAAKLNTMLDGVRSSGALIDEISRESREQASSIAEVNRAVKKIDEMTQHNASLVEETNAAIEQTEIQAAELDAIVEVFVVDQQASAEPQGKRRAA